MFLTGVYEFADEIPNRTSELFYLHRLRNCALGFTNKDVVKTDLVIRYNGKVCGAANRVSTGDIDLRNFCINDIPSVQSFCRCYER